MLKDKNFKDSIEDLKSSLLKKSICALGSEKTVWLKETSEKELRFSLTFELPGYFCLHEVSVAMCDALNIEGSRTTKLPDAILLDVGPFIEELTPIGAISIVAVATNTARKNGTFRWGLVQAYSTVLDESIGPIRYIRLSFTKALVEESTLGIASLSVKVHYISKF